MGRLAEAAGRVAPEPPARVPAPEAAGVDRYRELTEAERYAVTYPRRAALIRAHGGVQDDCGFGPPPPGLVRDIVTGSSPVLLEIDRRPALQAA